ncbi:B-lymphocyte antigen CD20-like isoform X2 [Cyprinodon tularosa]|nr:B-lymphocyte antigen CD20-like isoform X2 [Cyprinodon tularosa]
MSVTMSKTDGVTVFTLTSDPDSPWPPLCQILKSLCYSPVCCSVSQKLRATQRTSLSVLGAIHIMIGLLNIGLSIIVTVTYNSPWYLESYYPVWMGSLFIVFGIVCLLSEKFPSPCLIVLNVIFNIAGAAMAIAAIVLYSIYEGDFRAWYPCEENEYYYDYRRYTTTAPSPGSEYIKQRCLENRAVYTMLIRGMVGILIVLSVVEVCVAISSAVLDIKTLRRSRQKQEKASGDPELYNPLLEEVTIQPAA